MAMTLPAWALALFLLPSCARPDPVVGEVPVCEAGGAQQLAFASDQGSTGLHHGIEQAFVDQYRTYALRIFADCRYQAYHREVNGVGRWMDVVEGQLDEELAATWFIDRNVAFWPEEQPWITTWSPGTFMWSEIFGHYACGVWPCPAMSDEASWQLHDLVLALRDAGTPVAVRVEVMLREESFRPNSAFDLDTGDFPQVPWEQWLAASEDEDGRPIGVEVPDELFDLVVGWRDDWLANVRVPPNGYIEGKLELVHGERAFRLYIRTYPSESAELLEPIPGYPMPYELYSARKL